jgi:hypothetical protein
MAQPRATGGEVGRLRALRRGLAAALLGLALVAGVGGWPAGAEAQNACSSGCRAAYGACYKSTHDRSRCQVQLQRCLEGCIRSRDSSRRRTGLSGGSPALVPFGRGPGRFGQVEARGQDHVGPGGGRFGEGRFGHGHLGKLFK